MQKTLLGKRRNRFGLESLEARHLLTGTIGLSIDLVEVDENVGAVTITLLRSGDLEGNATVDYTTVADSATEGEDFTPRSGTFTFKPGVSAQQINVPINNDGEAESLELFRFELSNPTGGAELGQTSQQIQIIDDDSDSGPLFADDFESSDKWTVNANQTDSATTGAWQVGSPQATEWNSQTIQPDIAAEGQRGLITGAARVASAFSNDVDGGMTTALSPVINLPADELIDFSFSYFVGHDEGSSEADFLNISILPIEPAADAETVFEVSGTPTLRSAEWQSELLDLSSFAGQSIQIQITANDGGSENIFEAGIDDVFIDVLPEGPGTFSFGSSIVNVEEGLNATATLEIIRTRGRAGEVTVEVATSDDGATSNEDYEPLAQTVTFADGETSQTITINVNNDDDQESLENITVTLSNPSAGAALSDNAEATVRIIDDDRFALGMLPDLQAMEDNFDFNFIDMSEQPGRALYRFGTAVANSGDGPLEIWGGQSSGASQEVFQRVYEVDGGFYDRLAGSFVFHPGHGHVHLEGFAEFNLRAVEESGEVGDVVASGGKVSFCLINITHPYPEITAASSRPHGRGGDSCGTVQGISVGHADVYSSGLEGQWIDVTDLEDGDYFLEVIADPDNTLLELDETNNVLHAMVNVDNPFYADGEFVTVPEIPIPPGGGGGFGSPVGVPEDAVLVEAPEREAGDIETPGERDWYRFEAVSGVAYDAQVSLTGLGDSDMRLRDADGNELVYDDDGGVGLGSRITWIAPTDGTFYWDVGSLGDFGTGGYRFDFRELVDDHGANADSATALTLGEFLEGEIEFVSNQDWFSFEAVEGQYYQLEGSPRTIGDVRITLLDSDGTTEILSVDDGSRPGIARAIWQADESGTHFIQLQPGDDFGIASGSYRVRARVVDAPNDDFANDVSEASVLDVGAGVLGDIDYELDQDVFSVAVEQGVTYLVRVSAFADEPVDIDRPILQIADASGAQLAEFDGLGNEGITIEWTPDTTESHIFTVSGHAVSYTHLTLPTNREV